MFVSHYLHDIKNLSPMYGTAQSLKKNLSQEKKQEFQVKTAQFKHISSLNFFEHYFHYKKGFFLVKEKISEFLIYFYKIEKIVEKQNLIEFYVAEYIGTYDEFYCAYNIFDRQKDLKYIKYKDIQFKKSYETVFSKDNKKLYILAHNINFV